MTQSVFFFGNGKAEGTREMKSVLGGKGANLAEMTNLGVPVPAGFTIAASECIEYLKSGKYSDKLRAEVEGNIARLEQATGKKLGDPKNPLLVSVRSGAAVSMPGMMETILNLGLNDRSVVALAAQSKNARFAYDSYRRFIQMYADVVLGVPIHDFEHLLKAKRITSGAASDADLDEDDLRNLVEEYKKLVRAHTGVDFPRDPVAQLWGAIEAVWKSWTLKKARDYRRVHSIPEDLGTAVNIVSMVFGNLGDDSGTGVAFTRNPSTGEKKFYGEFLINAQGEDVVAGIRTPLDIEQMATKLPGAYTELMETQDRLERHYADMQDLEFTVERGKLYLLQTRTGKRTAAAAVRIARDMVNEKLIDQKQAVKRVPAGDLDQLLHPIIDPSVRAAPLCVGLPASPGAASGVAVFDPETAEERSAAGENVILVRDETTPEDFSGIVASRAVLTARGGMTSHAAVVARGMGKCAIVGCKEIEIDATHRSFRVDGTTVNEGDWLTLDGATGRVFTGDLGTLLHPIIDPSVRATPLCVGLPASPGAASGIAVFDPETAEERSAAGENVILVRDETTPEDFSGIVASRAVLTARGGMTSHAAVVARGMGKCAIVGCKEIEIDATHRSFRVDGTTVNEGDWLTLDGATGRVFTGDLGTVPSEVVAVTSGDLHPTQAPIYQSYAELMEWADDARTLKVRANADTPRDARIARSFGAEGIGLCRTEHMFFEGDRITGMREMIVAREEGGRRRALAKLLPMQRADFEGIFKEMDGLPVTIRLLDPPLHEFLPHGGEESKLLARTLDIPRADLNRIIESLRETNPMLGHRGCRLGITYPEITEMQGRAIFESALRAQRRGIVVKPEIMIPLVSTVAEFENQKAILQDIAEKVLGAMGETIQYLIGTMIELPRAALTAGAIAAQAEFFSFGTNDLTQTTLGLSRDDSGRFLPSYIEKGIFADDPFQVLDVEGVGRLIRIAVEDGRKARPDLKLGICGEHGGEPRSVAFCHSLGLDYVSCSPFRVPIARLAAAHAALNA